MSGRKIDKKKVRDTAIWGLLLVAIAAGLFFGVQRKRNAKVQTLKIEISGLNEGEQLINEKEVKQILQLAAGKSLTNVNIKLLDIRKLEAKLNLDKRIDKADLYFDSNDCLHVKVTQKQPIMRIMEISGTEYFLDKEGDRIPYIRGSIVRAPIVTGVRDTFFDKMLVSDRPSKLKEVFEVMKYVSEDPFLAALIEQAHIEAGSTSNIVLVPKVGREKIIFGDGSDIRTKFDNLKIFYKDGMPKLGWNRYKTLNLSYTKQVRGILADPSNAPKIKPMVQDTLTADLNSKNNHNFHN
ncbi:MAG: hypothetical protein LC107_00700 [Chitinophagales bacterium]|nr:hypothetical protein [Chitinophagales bacterium]